MVWLVPQAENVHAVPLCQHHNIIPFISFLFHLIFVVKTDLRREGFSIQCFISPVATLASVEPIQSKEPRLPHGCRAIGQKWPMDMNGMNGSLYGKPVLAVGGLAN